MNWKEFFKPTAAKVTTTIIFFVLGLIGFLANAGVEIRNPLVPQSQLSVQSMIENIFFSLLFVSFSLLPMMAASLIGGNISSASLLVGAILMVVWNYFLAAVVIYVYQKFKSRKK